MSVALDISPPSMNVLTLWIDDAGTTFATLRFPYIQQLNAATTTYNIYWYDTAAPTTVYSALNQKLDFGVSTYNVSSLAANTQYAFYFSIKNTVTNTTSANSSIVTGWTAPDAISISGSEQSFIVSTTTTNNTNQLLYTYSQASDKKVTANYATTAVIPTEKTDPTSTNYTMKVKVKNKFSFYSSPPVTVSFFALSTPTIQVTDRSPSSITCSIFIRDVSPLMVYNLYYGSGLSILNQSSNVFQLTGLTANTPYTMYAKVNMPSEVGTLTATSITTTHYTLPSVPTLDVTNISNTEMMISFTNVSGVPTNTYTYDVYCTSDSGTTLRSVNNTSSTNITLTGVDSSSLYKITAYVRGVASNLVNRATMSTLNLQNYNFYYPTVSTQNTYTEYASADYAKIQWWNTTTTASANLNLCICKGSTAFCTYDAPHSQYLTVNHVNASTTTTMTQLISLTAGTYRMSFFVAARSTSYTLNTLTINYESTQIYTKSEWTDTSGKWNKYLTNSFVVNSNGLYTFSFIYTGSNHCTNITGFQLIKTPDDLIANGFMVEPQKWFANGRNTFLTLQGTGSLTSSAIYGWTSSLVGTGNSGYSYNLQFGAGGSGISIGDDNKGNRNWSGYNWLAFYLKNDASTKGTCTTTTTEELTPGTYTLSFWAQSVTDVIILEVFVDSSRIYMKNNFIHATMAKISQTFVISTTKKVDISFVCSTTTNAVARDPALVFGYVYLSKTN